MLLASSLTSTTSSGALLRFSCRRLFSDNRQVLARSAWIPSDARHARRLPRRLRPVVNGQVVPFHVQDLPHKTIATNTVFRKSHTEVTRPIRSYSSDLIVVLDLDECLVHAKFFDEPDKASLYAHQVQNTNTTSTSLVGSETETEPVESFRLNFDRNVLAHVNMRPGVLGFLQEITSKYETHIYTAATSIYADAVLDHLCACLGSPDTDLFAGRWYREHCAHDIARGAYVKDLSRLPVPLHRTVLVDNNPLSFLAQPENGIMVNSFFADGADRTLESLSQFIATELEPAADVRRVLLERFQLPELLKRLEAESSTTTKSSLQSKPSRPHLAML
jgi:Dullard-like phosphatase family protein